jgi:hypothetical protein
MRRHRVDSDGFSFWIIAIVALAIVGGAYVWYRSGDEPPAPEVKVIPPAPPEPLALPPAEPRYVVPETPPPREVSPEPVEEYVPLPELDESDAAMQEAMAAAADAQQISSLFVPENFIRQFVVNIDNLTQPKLPQKFRIYNPPSGRFAVREGGDETVTLDPANFERYAPFVRFLDSIDTDRAVRVYMRFYPLFQQAYQDLGYPDRYFNDRFVEVIDHLLKAPQVQGPIALVQPRVYYQFANPELEALSAGQKLLIRIGPANAEIVKSRLRELRALLTALPDIRDD